MKSILTIGEILVEIMATERGDGFLEPVKLIGPFPSGAPAIFIDQAARFGQPAAMIGCVGDDDFGRVNLEPSSPRRGRCERRPDRPGGGDGQRLRALPDRRVPRLRLQHQAERLGAHCTRRGGARRSRTQRPSARDGNGPLLAEIVDIVLKAARAVKARGGTISFDPNLRPEMLNLPGPSRGLRRAFSPMRPLSAEWPRAYPVHERKRREGGHRRNPRARGPRRRPQAGRRKAPAISTPRRASTQPGFKVEEVDPTGAGDCFGATFVSCWLRDMPPACCLAYAAASGALAVTRQGPMEGAASQADLDAFLAARS